MRHLSRALMIPSTLASALNGAGSRGTGVVAPGCVASAPVQLLMYAPPTNYTAPGEHVEIQQLILINRHGDRGPISRTAGTALVMDAKKWKKRMPSEKTQTAWDTTNPVAGPRTPADTGESPFGQLTEVGARQCFELGKWLQASISLHSPQLLPMEARHISAHATNIRRTQQSVQNILGGLLGEASPRLSVPIIVRDLADERLIPRPPACPPLRRRLDELGSAKRAATASTEEMEVITRVRCALGYPEGGLRLDQAREVLVCALSHGDALPAGVSDHDVGELLTINAKQWDVLYSDSTVAALGMGRLLAEVDEHLTAAAKGDEGAPRLVLLSGHDSTIVPLLSALGLFDRRWPPYAAHVRIELGTVHGPPEGAADGATGLAAGTIAVRVLYQGLPLPLAQAVDEAAADPAGWVPLSSFQALMRRAMMTADEYSEACAASSSAAAIGGDSALQDTLVGSKKP